MSDLFNKYVKVKQLRKLVEDYNLHTMIPKYTKMNKSELKNAILKHMITVNEDDKQKFTQKATFNSEFAIVKTRERKAYSPQTQHLLTQREKKHEEDVLELLTAKTEALEDLKRRSKTENKKDIAKERAEVYKFVKDEMKKYNQEYKKDKQTIRGTKPRKAKPKPATAVKTPKKPDEAKYDEDSEEEVKQAKPQATPKKSNLSITYDGKEYPVNASQLLQYREFEDFENTMKVNFGEDYTSINNDKKLNEKQRNAKLDELKKHSDYALKENEDALYAWVQRNLKGLEEVEFKDKIYWVDKNVAEEYEELLNDYEEGGEEYDKLHEAFERGEINEQEYKQAEKQLEKLDKQREEHFNKQARKLLKLRAPKRSEVENLGSGFKLFKRKYKK